MLKKHIMYFITQSINEINIFNEIKNFIFECVNKRYLNISNPTYIMRKNICDCISVLIIAGIGHAWPTCIEELIKEVSNGPEFCFIVLRAIADLDLIINFNTSIDSWDDVLTSQENEKLLIREKLINHKEMVFNLVNKVINDLNSFEYNLKIRIISAIIDLIKCWTHFDLNLLTNPVINQKILSLIDLTEGQNKINNINTFSEMLCQSMNNSKNSMLYLYYGKAEESSSIEVLENINNNVDNDEKNGVYFYLDFILKKMQISNGEIILCEEELLIYAKIFASIMENFIYFFFNFSDNKTGICLQYLKYFIKYKKRKISWMFFQTINNIMVFIVDYYCFTGLNENQKNEFLDYLFEIFIGIMENCALKNINTSDTSQLQNELLTENVEFIWNKSKLNGEDIEIDDIDIKEYRSGAENVLMSIFIIIIDCYSDDSKIKFLQKIISLIPINELTNQLNINNINLYLKIDLVLLALKSIINAFPEEKNSYIGICQIYFDFITILINSPIIENNNYLLSDFLMLIYTLAKYFNLNKEIFVNIFNFLLNISSKDKMNRIINDSCYKILNIICFNLDTSSINVNNQLFDALFKRFTLIYNDYNLNNIKPLINILESLLFIIGVNQDKKDDNKSLVPDSLNKIQKIYCPFVNELHLITSNISNNTENILRISKIFILIKEIFITIRNYDDIFANKILDDFLSNTNNDLKIILTNFSSNNELMNNIIKFYEYNSRYIGINCHSNFKILNEIFINYNLLLDLLLDLYSEYLGSISQKDNNYFYCNKYILTNFFIVANKMINNFKQNSLNDLCINQIKKFLEYFKEIFPKLYINICDENKNIIEQKEIMNYENEIAEIINFLLYFSISLSQKQEFVTDYLISLIIKAFISIFKNDSLNKVFIVNFKFKENNMDLFCNIIIQNWKFIYLDKFGCLSGKALEGVFCQMSKCDINYFTQIFGDCLKEKNLIDLNYIESTLKFIKCFNDREDKKLDIFKEIIGIFRKKKEPSCLDFYIRQVKNKT